MLSVSLHFGLFLGIFDRLLTLDLSFDMASVNFAENLLVLDNAWL